MTRIIVPLGRYVSADVIVAAILAAAPRPPIATAIPAVVVVPERVAVMT